MIDDERFARLNDYLDGELTGAEQQEFEALIFLRQRNELIVAIQRAKRDVAGAAHAAPEVGAVATHRGDHARPVDAPHRVHDRLAHDHRGVEEQLEGFVPGVVETDDARTLVQRAALGAQLADVERDRAGAGANIDGAVKHRADHALSRRRRPVEAQHGVDTVALAVVRFSEQTGSRTARSGSEDVDPRSDGSAEIGSEWSIRVEEGSAGSIKRIHAFKVSEEHGLASAV